MHIHIVYVDKSIERKSKRTHKLYKLVNEFSKVAGGKISIKNQLYFCTLKIEIRGYATRDKRRTQQLHLSEEKPPEVGQFKKVSAPLFPAALFTTPSTRQPRWSSPGEQTRQRWTRVRTCTCTLECSTARTETWVSPFVTTWIGLEGITLRESKSEEDKHCIISLRCGIQKS